MKKYYSNCCYAYMHDYPDSDICPKCKEHCEGITDHLETSSEFPKEMQASEMRSQCLAVHVKVVAEKDRELQKYKDNTLRIICGDCSKAHNPTFEEVVNLGCAICNKEQIAKLKEENAELKYNAEISKEISGERDYLQRVNKELRQQIEGLKYALSAVQMLIEEDIEEDRGFTFNRKKMLDRINEALK